MKVINWKRLLKCNYWILIALLKHPQFFNRFQACKKNHRSMHLQEPLFAIYKIIPNKLKKNQIHTIKTWKKFLVPYGLKVISFNCPN